MFLVKHQSEDKHLIQELAAQAIHGPIYNIRPLGGHVSYNYEINNNIVLKLPSRRTVPERWIEQSHYIPYLQQHLNYEIPMLKASTLHLPFGDPIIACTYPKIQGHTFSKDTFYQRPFSQKISFFEELSEAMIQLHSVPPKSLPYSFKTYLDYIAQFLFKTPSDKKDLFHKKIHDIFEEKKIPLRFSLLCHTDLHPGNVVLKDQKGLVGIVDWDSLCLGDSFMEFHSPLYTEGDLHLFREIYSKSAPKPIDQQATECLKNLQKNILFLCAVDSQRQQIKSPAKETHTPSIKDCEPPHQTPCFLPSNHDRN